MAIIDKTNTYMYTGSDITVTYTCTQAVCQLPTANFCGVMGKYPLPESDYHMVNNSRDPSNIKTSPIFMAYQNTSGLPQSLFFVSYPRSQSFLRFDTTNSIPEKTETNK